MNMKLDWLYQNNNDYYRLNSVDLSHEHFDELEGIYIIWCEIDGVIQTVYIGQGEIRNRLYVHRNDVRIQHYAPYTLYVAWAKASKEDLDGIEKYLQDLLEPLVKEREIEADPIPVIRPPILYKFLQRY